MASPTVSAKEASDKGHPINFTKIDIPKDTEEIPEGETFLNIDEDNQMIDCFLNLPPLEQMANPIMIININNHQQADLELQQALQADPDHYMLQNMNGIEIVVYHMCIC